jgi:predicted peroxiredoxin
MAGKAVISLTTGLEDPEKVTVAFLVAVGAAESGRPTSCSRPRKPSGSP